MSKNILDAIAPLRLMSKLCGFSFNRLDFSTSFKRKDVCNQIWIIAINCLMIYFLLDSSYHPMNKSDIINHSLPIVLAGNFGLYILCVVVLSRTRGKQAKMLRFICEIDEMLKDFGVHFDYCRLRRKLSYIVIGTLLLDTIIVSQFSGIQHFYGDEKFSLCVFVYFWIIICFTNLVTTFVFLARLVKERFKRINQCLKKTLSPVDVQKLASIHQDLAEVIAYINQIYSTLMSFYFGGIFCVCNLFFFNLVILRNYFSSVSEAAVTFICNFEWNIYDAMVILAIIHSSASTVTESRNALSFIYKTVNTSVDAELNRRLLNFSRQISSTRLEFSCGLFNFDWSLCFKFFSASVMYVVILIQFEKALPKKS